MKVYGLNKSGKTFASEMALDDAYGQNTSDGVVLNPPTTNKKKKKKKDKMVNPNRKSTKTVPSKSKETNAGESDKMAGEGGAGSGNFAPGHKGIKGQRGGSRTGSKGGGLGGSGSSSEGGYGKLGDGFTKTSFGKVLKETSIGDTLRIHGMHGNETFKKVSNKEWYSIEGKEKVSSADVHYAARDYGSKEYKVSVTRSKGKTK